MTVYIAYSCAGVGAATQTAPAIGGVAYTAGASRMMLQLNSPASAQLRLIEWGVSCNGSAAATPNMVELSIASAGTTVTTAHTTSTILPINDPNAAPSRLTMATSGFYSAAVARTTCTVSKVLDAQFIAPTSQFVKLWPLGREPVVPVSVLLQMVSSGTTAATMVGYVAWEEI